MLKLDQIKEAIQKAIEQVTGGRRSCVPRTLTSALKNAVEKFGKVREAFKCLANVKKEPVVDLAGLVAKQPAASRYKIYEVVETAARKSAMRMGTVGLAFSGGGIRSATFNLGFLQGMALLGLLKQFDYLSTVSGGGYIGTWFAAWVLREGGCEPERPTSDDLKREIAKSRATEEQAKKILEKRYEDEIAAKRRLTSQVENVQKQLCTSRARQAEAVRGWVPPGKTASPQLPPTSLPKTVEDEPAPVHHLREHSNYLAPKIGLCRSTPGRWFRYTFATFSSTSSSCCRSCWP